MDLLISKSLEAAVVLERLRLIKTTEKGKVDLKDLHDFLDLLQDVIPDGVRYIDREYEILSAFRRLQSVSSQNSCADSKDVVSDFMTGKMNALRSVDVSTDPSDLKSHVGFLCDFHSVMSDHFRSEPEHDHYGLQAIS